MIPCLLAFPYKAPLLYKQNRAIIIPNHPRTGMIRKNKSSRAYDNSSSYFLTASMNLSMNFFILILSSHFRLTMSLLCKKSRTRILFEPPCSAFLYHITSFFSVQSLFYVTSINLSIFRDISVFSIDCKSISSVPFRLI